jgi:hypothetical protein
MTNSGLQLIVAGLLTLAVPLATPAQDEADTWASWSRRHAQAMAEGRDHHDASRIATRHAPVTKQEMEGTVAWMRRHKEAMERGLTHLDASRVASSSDAKEATTEEVEATRAWMRRHKEAMDRGMSHLDASREADHP